MEDKITVWEEKEKLRIMSLTDTQGDYMHPVFGEGDRNATVLLIGEAPGKDEAMLGRPFVGKAGKQLDSLLDMAGIDRKSLYVTNSVKYRPWKCKVTSKGSLSYSNRTPTHSEIEVSGYLLECEIKMVAPKVVVTLGNSPLYAVKHITDSDFPCNIGAVHGQAVKTDDFILFPLYHPASGIYNRSLIDVMENDTKKLGEFIRNLKEG